jgi:hypothetical protein
MAESISQLTAAMTTASDFDSALNDRYAVRREIGSGGMATVFLARDDKHERDVAIKVLHPDLAATLGGERFLAEIRTTARLQHPHILPLLDSGEANGRLYYVMPFVSGETLRARLDRDHQLPIDETVRIAREVADALGYAHSLGVIHRDIKPENILLQDGHAIVADFGIALAVQSAGGGRLTQTGLSLGTPQYMSPEQAMGERTIDARSDIYALGAVVYEMLTGDPPFTGSTVQAIVAKVMTERPTPPRTVRDTVPAHVESAVLKALAKLPADRFGSARDFAAVLTGVQSVGIESPNASAPRALRTRRDRLLIGALGSIALAGVAASAWLATHRGTIADDRLIRFDVRLPDSVSLYSGARKKLALSHDGSMLVVAGVRGATMGLYLRRMSEPAARLIRGTETPVTSVGPSPAFSADDKNILFEAAESQLVVPVTGGTARKIADSALAGSWIGGDTVIFVRDRAVWLVSSASHASHLIASPDTASGVYDVKWPHLLPGGTHCLVTLDRSRLSGEIDSLYLGVLSIADGKVTPLGVRGSDARYLASGHIVFGRPGGEIGLAPFSLSRKTITGPLVKVAEDVWQANGGATDFAVSDDGKLAYTSGGPSELRREVLIVDRSGRERRIPTAPGAVFPRVSPDGRHVATGGGWNLDGGVWSSDVASGAEDRVAANGAGFRPEWTRDGKDIVYLRSHGGVREVVAHSWDRNGDDRVLVRDSIRSITDVVLGPPHGLAIFVAQGEPHFYVAPMDSLASMRPLALASLATAPVISPDGRLVAYGARESGASEIYVQALVGSGRRVRISVAGGTEPRWAPNGKAVLYRTSSRLMEASLDAGLEVTRRDSLFVDDMERSPSLQRQNWDVMPNGQEFLMVRWRSSNLVSVVVNWRKLIEAKK